MFGIKPDVVKAVAHNSPKISQELLQAKETLKQIRKSDNFSEYIQFRREVGEDTYYAADKSIKEDEAKALRNKQVQQWDNSMDFVQKGLHKLDPQSRWIPRWLVPAHPDITNEENRLARIAEDKKDRADRDELFKLMRDRVHTHTIGN
jgi:hypothetical protein